MVFRKNPLQLTAVTAVNNLSTSYNTSGGYLDSFITNYVNNNFSKGYVGGNEYIFFSNRMCTNESKSFIFIKNSPLGLITEVQVVAS